MAVYKCPADQSIIKFGSASMPKPRSFSMNCWLSPYPGPPRLEDAATIFGGTPCRIFFKESDLTAPGPSLTFVLIDENANSIDDGYFAGSPGLPNNGSMFRPPATVIQAAFRMPTDTRKLRNGRTGLSSPRMFRIIISTAQPSHVIQIRGTTLGLNKENQPRCIDADATCRLQSDLHTL